MLIFRQLQVHRITMHKNLFAALLLNATLKITFKAVVILDEINNLGFKRTIMEENFVSATPTFQLTVGVHTTDNFLFSFSIAPVK